MMMTVIWSEKAKYSFNKKLDRIHKFHNLNEVVNYMTLVDQVIRNIKTGVLQVKPYDKTNNCSFVISKQTTLFYQVNKEQDRLELLLFWRNKEDPKKLVNFLKDFEKKH